jgi:hypothetical protein
MVSRISSFFTGIPSANRVKFKVHEFLCQDSVHGDIAGLAVLAIQYSDVTVIEIDTVPGKK